MSRREEISISVSDFEFTCPGCGIEVGEWDQVWTLPISELVRWPVCADCGRRWVEDQISQ